MGLRAILAIQEINVTVVVEPVNFSILIVSLAAKNQPIITRTSETEH